jgi:excisionase family DNA binding protein
VNLELEHKDIVQIAEAVAERILGATTPRTQWLTRPEAAEHLRCSTAQLDRLVHLGELPVYRPNRKPLFSAADLDKYVTDRRED